MSLPGPPLPIITGTYSNFADHEAKPLTYEALRAAMRALRGDPPEPPKVERIADTIEIAPEVKACVDCGTWNGCVCAKPESMPPTCYLCSAVMSSRNGIIPRRCWTCAKLYLGER